MDFESKYSIHDGELLGISQRDRELTLRIWVIVRADIQRGGQAIATYTDVDAFEFDMKSAKLTFNRLGDILIDEVEELQEGCYEHRMLFDSRAELMVRFGGFRYRKEGDWK